jgi:hypothetical protein
MSHDTYDPIDRTVRTHEHADRPRGAVWRHYAEMVVAMFAGMLVLGGLRGLAGLTASWDAAPGTAYVLMATDMALAMGAWMVVRGHSWAHAVEMCLAMYVPVLLLPLVWLEVIGAMTFMIAAHVVMMVVMLVVLVRQHGGRNG